jgi:predicted transcriptional regulator
VALAMVLNEPGQFKVTNAISVGVGCRVEDAHRMVYSRGLRFENPERDAVKVGITCRLCDRADCTQRALPSFKMETEINTINRKENILSPIQTEDLLLIAEERDGARQGKRN